MARKKTSIAISEEGARLRALLSERLGINQTAVLELSLRDLARREGLLDERVAKMWDIVYGRDGAAEPALK